MNAKMKRALALTALSAVGSLTISMPARAATELGIALNGACVAGACPAAGPVSNDTVSLSYSGTLTLADGDVYRAVVALTESGAPLLGDRYIQMTYQGHQGDSGVQPLPTTQNDVINVDIFRAWAATSKIGISEVLTGTFADGIAATSSLSASMTDLETGNIVADFGRFDASSAVFAQALKFQLVSDGATALSKGSYELVFGAGSKVRASLTVGRPPTVPEPGTMALYLLGLVGLTRLVKRPSVT